MSKCDACPKPGACCKVMFLHGARSGKPVPSGDDHAEADNHLKKLGLPMRALFDTGEDRWAVWCPNLDRLTGLCRDYENRPELCKDFEPGENPLCCLHPDTMHQEGDHPGDTVTGWISND